MLHRESGFYWVVLPEWVVAVAAVAAAAVAMVIWFAFRSRRTNRR